LEKLKALTFQKELGSYYDKAQRVKTMASYWAAKLDPDGRIGLSPEEAERAGEMSKCDLRTLMVGEFPELQGVMGGEYLKSEGEPENVWRAVKEHYKPVSADDTIPENLLGCLLSVVDKFDTVSACIAVGLIPTGSKDPLALRRAAQGVVRIIWEKGLSLDLKDLIYQQANHLESLRLLKDRKAFMTSLMVFMKDRVAFQLEQSRYPAPVRRSILATIWADPNRDWNESLELSNLRSRCDALSIFAEDPRFASLSQSAKRIGNILKDEFLDLKSGVAVLQQEEEKALAQRLASLEALVDQKALLEALADLAGPLEAFFSAVMVKCEDPALRAARLSLLHRLRQTFLRVADFSLWQ
jgi:glycyl-tRNA synthetase beta chain